MFMHLHQNYYLVYIECDMYGKNAWAEDYNYC